MNPSPRIPLAQKIHEGPLVALTTSRAQETTAPRAPTHESRPEQAVLETQIGNLNDVSYDAIL